MQSLNTPFNECRSSVTSQSGEDGVLKEVFSRMGIRNKYCVELGAWDGKYLSNVWQLWHNEGWSAALIECERDRCEALRESTAEFPSVQVIHALATPTGEHALDALLVPRGVPKDLDLLSIDIDGDDYHLFANLKELRPRCLVIEFNPTVPPSVSMVQQAGRGPFGASARALVELAHERNYRLVTATDTNLILVTEDDFGRLGIEEPALEDVFPSQFLTYVISAFNGSTYLSQRPIYGPSPKQLPRLGRRKKLSSDISLESSIDILPVSIHRYTKRPLGK